MESVLHEPDSRIQLAGAGMNFRKSGATIHPGANPSIGIIGFIDGIVAEDSRYWKFRTVPLFI